MIIPAMNGLLPDGLSIEDRRKCENFFHQLQSGGYVDGLKARDFFLKSGLPQTTLAKIWENADFNKDGRLNFTEFCTAFYNTSKAARQRAASVEVSTSPACSINGSQSSFYGPASTLPWSSNSPARRNSDVMQVYSLEKQNRTNGFDFSVFAQTLPKSPLKQIQNGAETTLKSIFPERVFNQLPFVPPTTVIRPTSSSTQRSRRSAEQEILRNLMKQKQSQLTEMRGHLEETRLISQTLNSSVKSLSGSLLVTQKAKYTEEGNIRRKTSGLKKLAEFEENVRFSLEALNFTKTSMERRNLENGSEVVYGVRFIDHTADIVAADMDIHAAKQKFVTLRETAGSLTVQISSMKGHLEERRKHCSIIQNELRNLLEENKMLGDVFQTKQQLICDIPDGDRQRETNLSDGYNGSDVQPACEPRQVVALADYIGNSDNELTFTVGEEITLLEEREDGWWLGRKGQSTAAYFPATYVKSKAEAPKIQMIAIYDYQAQNDDELSFSAEDILELLPRDGDGDGWIYGRLLRTNTFGLAPANYLRLPNQTVEKNDVTSEPERDSRERTMAIQELYRTEQAYLNDMLMVLEVFYNTLHSSAVCTKEELDEMFSGWHDLIACTTKLLTAIKSVVGEPLCLIGHALCASLPDPTPYILFCSRQVRMGELIHQKTNSNPKFDELLRSCSQDSRLKGLPLSAAYVKPMQRVTRYHLLIKRILETTPNNHVDHDGVMEAMRMAENLCEQVNEGVRAAESVQRFQWLEKNVDMNDLSPDIFKFDSLTNCMKQRVLIYSGSLIKVKTGRELVAFLFNDILLLTTPSKPMISVAGNFSFDKKLWTGTKLKLYKKPLLISKCTAVMSQDDVSFSVKFPESSGITLLLKGTTPGESRAWVKKLSEISELGNHSQPVRRSSRIPEGCCRIIVMDATELSVDPRKKRCDPYCRINLDNQENRTKVVNNSIEPKWDHNMNLIVYDMENEVLSLTVWDYNLYCPDRFLGRSELRLRDILRDSNVPGVPVLKRVLLREVDSGEVTLKLDVQRFSPK